MTDDTRTRPYWPRAAGENDASAEANAKVATEIAARCNKPIPYDQLVTRPTAPVIKPRG
jgi:hypothetical protein